MNSKPLAWIAAAFVAQFSHAQHAIPQGPLPPTSLFGAVRPNVGGPGSTVNVLADLSAFTGYAAKDAVLVGAAPVGQASAYWGKIESLSPVGFRGRIADTHPFAQAQPLKARFGAGATFAVPPLGPVSYPGGVYRWRAPQGAPEFTTSNSFAALTQYIDQPCTTPPNVIHARFRLVGGCLRAKLPGPGAMSKDQLSATVMFETDSESVLFDFDVSAIPAGVEMDWDVAYSLLTWPIGFGLPSTCNVTYDPVTNELVICPNGSTVITSVSPLSSIEIALDESTHVFHEAVMGAEVDANDPFGSPGPDTAPQPDFLSWVDSTYHPLGYFRYDDDSTCDRFFVESSDPLQLGAEVFDGAIRSAVVEVYMRGFACQTYTDGIWFGWNGSAISWSAGLPTLEQLTFQWNVGDQAKLCFDLDALPLAGGGLRSILDDIYRRDGVDLVVQDDTEVEHVIVRVLRYQP